MTGAARALVIGGRKFLGPALVEACRDAGVAVTLFCRGRTNPELFADLDVVLGDRATDLGRLAGRRFDFAIDTCGYRPEQLEVSTRALADLVERYVFISTASVYAELGAASVAEDHATASLSDAPAGSPESYGPLKARCEIALVEAFADRALILRPGLIAGPRDPTDRFTYWPLRMRRGGRVLAPGDGRDPVQVIAAADVARFAVSGALRGLGGVFNLAGPAAPLRFAGFLAAVARGCGVEPDLEWISSDFLLERDVGPWRDLPCWIPRTSESAGILRLDISRALAAGLGDMLTPIDQLAAETLAWRGEGAELAGGLDPATERELLNEWTAWGPD